MGKAQASSEETEYEVLIPEMGRGVIRSVSRFGVMGEQGRLMSSIWEIPRISEGYWFFKMHIFVNAGVYTIFFPSLFGIVIL